ncbi:uncharacterized protein VTP21DRAFT_9462 [Calcarisporiella thermophila]|uniref:uncharacterized protein n=1 Tax=Calcarisporiella thermophila TaxID=911321 RepID=UPI00374263EA
MKYYFIALFLVLPNLLSSAQETGSTISNFPPCVVGYKTDIWAFGRVYDRTGIFNARAPFSVKNIPWTRIGDLPAIMEGYCVLGLDRIYFLGAAGSFSGISSADYTCNLEYSSTTSSSIQSTTSSFSSDNLTTSISTSQSIITSTINSFPTSPTSSSSYIPSSLSFTTTTSSLHLTTPTPTTLTSTTTTSLSEPSTADSLPDASATNSIGEDSTDEGVMGKSIHRKGFQIKRNVNGLNKRQSQIQRPVYFYDLVKKTVCIPPQLGEGLETLEFATRIVAAMISKSEMFILGGQNGALQAYLLNVDKWSIESLHSEGPKPVNLQPQSVAAIVGSTVYLFGAYSPEDVSISGSFTLYSYDLHSKKWSKEAKSVFGNISQSLVAPAADNQIYVIPVRGTGSGPVQAFDPASRNFHSLDINSDGNASFIPQQKNLISARALPMYNQIAVYNFLTNGSGEYLYSLDIDKKQWSQVLEPTGDALIFPITASNQSTIDFKLIIGSVVGGVGGLALVVGIVVYLIRRRRNHRQKEMTMSSHRNSLQRSRHSLRSIEKRTAKEQPLPLSPSSTKFDSGSASFLSDSRLDQRAPYLTQLSAIPTHDPRGSHHQNRHSISHISPQMPRHFSPQNMERRSLSLNRPRVSIDSYISSPGGGLGSSMELGGDSPLTMAELHETYFSSQPMLLHEHEIFQYHPHAAGGSIILDEYSLMDEPVITATNGGLVRQAVRMSDSSTVSLVFFADEYAFCQEVTIARYLASPYVMRVIEAFELQTPGHLQHISLVYPFLLVAEPTRYRLDQVIRSRPSFDDVTYWRLVAKNIAQSLMHLHNRKIVHLNLEPACFFSEADDMTTWQLAAFHFAHFYGENLQDIPLSNYSPPELLLLHPSSAACFKMDMWSAGCVLYELYTRVPLFTDAEDARAQLMADGVQWQPPLRNVQTDEWIVPEKDIREILLGLLQVIPEKRWDATWLLRMLNTPQRDLY